MIESIIQVYLEVQKSTLFAHAVRNFILELPCTSVESYAWLYVKTRISLLSFCTETTRTTFDTRHRYQVFIKSISSQQVPRSYCYTKRVTPLESSHDRHLPTGGASARADS